MVRLVKTGRQLVRRWLVSLVATVVLQVVAVVVLLVVPVPVPVHQRQVVSELWQKNCWCGMQHGHRGH